VPGVTVTKRIHFSTRSRGKREIVEGAGEAAVACSSGRVPRVSRLMALAIKVDGLIASGAIADQAEAARLGHVTRARMTQIMNLLLLAPDIQEAVLNLPLAQGSDALAETDLRPLAAEVDWGPQRARWLQLLDSRGATPRLAPIDHRCG
jgi:hypothetical protein